MPHVHTQYRIAFVHQASRSNLDDPAPSDLGPQILTSLANESDEQLSPERLSMSDAVAELMLVKD